MSLAFFGWLIVASSMPILLHFLMGAKGLRKVQPDMESCKASLEDIGARQKNGKLSEAEADAARLALLSGLRSRRRGFSTKILGHPKLLLVASAVFLLVSGIGAAVSYDRSAQKAISLKETISFSEPDGEVLAHLTDYAGSIETEQPPPTTSAASVLPDVNAMIERLAARLETTPQDLEGWRMLGWSYFHTERYEQAVMAFGKALALDPGSAELKRSYEEAKAKADRNDGPIGGEALAPEGMPERDAAIRAMVDGPAQRLESSPQDVDGWIHLMRSRVVLGETEVAATAFRKALEVFVADQAASGKITAAAIELGLKVQ